MSVAPLGEQGAGYMRLAGMLVSGFGMVYVISGRLNADGFVFATLLDRPLVPVVVAILWYMNSIPFQARKLLASCSAHRPQRTFCQGGMMSPT